MRRYVIARDAALKDHGIMLVPPYLSIPIPDQRVQLSHILCVLHGIKR